MGFIASCATRGFGSREPCTTLPAVCSPCSSTGRSRRYGPVCCCAQRAFQPEALRPTRLHLSFVPALVSPQLLETMGQDVLLELGTPVWHPERGHGRITAMRADSASVTYENGEVHAYSVESAQKLNLQCDLGSAEELTSTRTRGRAVTPGPHQPAPFAAPVPTRCARAEPRGPNAFPFPPAAKPIRTRR